MEKLTRQEREQYRQRLQEAKSKEEQERIRAEYRERVRERTSQPAETTE